MNELHRLPARQHRAGLAHALHNLFVVRGAVYPADRGNPCAADRRAQQDANQGAGRLAGAWTQRDRDPAVGGWVGGAACADWPGRAQGIRSPEVGETPLSMDEVLHALKIKLIADDDSIDKWPAVRIYRSAGAWVSATPGAPRARWFDAVVTA